MFLVACVGQIIAQQDARYSQYMFNMMPVNPGYAGSREAVTFLFAHRNQWSGIEDGAPVTSSLAIHSPLRKGSMGLGLELLQDRIGPKINTAFLATYSYKVRVGSGKLSFGLRGGLYNYLFDWNKID